jgi:hypothetical protein
MCQLAERFNRPGEFAAIPAGETHYLPKTHMNMYFRKNDPKAIAALNARLDAVKPAEAVLEAVSEARREAVRGYWNVLGDPETVRDPVILPHHTLWQGIPEFTNAERQRVIEIHSDVGNAEVRDQSDIPNSFRTSENMINQGKPSQKYAARELLDAGEHLGFIGASDNHEGQAGCKHITAVFASECSRDAILDAVWERRCNASSGDRSLVEFSTKNGVMGRTLPHTELPTFTLSVTPDAQVTAVQLIHNGRTVLSQPWPGGATATFKWTPGESAAGYCYARILQGDHGVYYASPIWI